jgi:hypothetical protein
MPILLNAYYSNPTKKDSMDRRIRNALHLLVQSDMQAHDSIAAALSVCTIESLVCKPSADLSNMIAENTAAILEPDPRERAHAVEFVKRLYDARSKTLHGAQLEHAITTRYNARLLAGALLVALLERREFQKAAGFPHETPDNLLDELKKGKWVPGQLTGVNKSPIRDLWLSTSD